MTGATRAVGGDDGWGNHQKSGGWGDEGSGWGDNGYKQSGKGGKQSWDQCHILCCTLDHPDSVEPPENRRGEEVATRDPSPWAMLTGPIFTPMAQRCPINVKSEQHRPHRYRWPRLIRLRESTTICGVG